MHGRSWLQQGGLHILGNIDQHGTRTTGIGNLEGLCHHIAQLGRIRHHKGVFGTGQRHAQNIDLLKGIGTDKVASHLTSNRHHRHRIHHGIGKTRDEVGRTGTGGGDANPHLTRATGIAYGSHGCTLLMTAEQMGDAAIIQSVIDRHNGPPGITENLSHTLLV